jgi:two-component system response regulator HydG
MKDTAFILIVDPDEEHAEHLNETLRKEGHACRTVQTGPEAVESIQTRRPDVILLDVEANGGESFIDLVKQASKLAPDASMILTLPKDADADRLAPTGVEIYAKLVKPVELPELRKLVAAAAAKAQRDRDSRALAEQAERSVEFEGIITANPQMLRVIKTTKRVADSKLTVLVLGESGTGKELIARAVHKHSPRKNKPYRAINCAGLHENLLESELFGHVKGAFTGAVTDRKGLFEVVDGGTLFLDEVGDMPMAMQAKLLRTLENGEIQPVGANETRRVDVRIVAATRQDVRSMVDSGDFRDDLFYRLNQATIRLPPLRDRREDIPLLIQHFIKIAAESHGKQVDSISPEAVRKLTSPQWPGNVRELRSVIEQMVVLADGPELDVDDLPDYLHGTTDIVVSHGLSTAGLTMEQLEKLHIANTLQMAGGNREKTAKLLGIGARTLYRKLREYDLQ